MEFIPSKASGDLIDGENWDRILKFAGVNIVVGVATILILMVVMSIVGQRSPLSLVVVLGILLCSQAYLLSWYEEWRGCHFKKKD